MPDPNTTPVSLLQPEGAPHKPSLGAWLRSRFVAGMLIALPIVATFIILEFIVNEIDKRVVPLLPPALKPETYLDYAVPGFGLLVLVIFLTLLGAVAANFLGRMFVRVTDRLLLRIPVVSSLYAVFKQIRDVFQNSATDQYKEVVMVQYPKADSWAIGFLVGPARGEIRERFGDDQIGVFVPTTPNPTSGFLLYVKASDVVRMSMSIEDGVKIILSGGLVVPDPQRSDPSAVPAFGS